MNKELQEKMNEGWGATKAVAEKVERITECRVQSEFYGGDDCSKKYMHFYIFIDDKYCSSKTEYKRFEVLYQDDITVENYVNYILKNINNKLAYTKGKVCDNVITAYKFIDNDLFTDFEVNPVNGVISIGNEQIFQVNENCKVKTSVKDRTIVIEDKDYCRILIDLKSDSYIKELAKNNNLGEN